MNNIIYDIPDEPTAGNSISSISAQVDDLRDDINELTETVHNQWIQFCNDNKNMEDRFTVKHNTLFILLVVNMGISVILIYAVACMLVM